MKTDNELLRMAQENTRLMTNRAEAAEARAAQAEAERDEARRALEQARRAMSLADVNSLDALCDWICGAQSELASLGEHLRDIWDMQAAYMRGEVPIDKITIA